MPTDGNLFVDAVDRFARSFGPDAAARSQQPVAGRDGVASDEADWIVESLAQDDSPVRYLCGCPDKPGKLNIDDVRAFRFRIASAGANSGVLYSLRGFTKPAIALARASGIACCMLYADRPAEVPYVVNVVALHARPEIRLALQDIETLTPPPTTWGDLFNHPIQQPDGGTRSVLDTIGEAFAGAEAATAQSRAEKGLAFPPNGTATIEFSGCSAQIRVIVQWRRFRAPLQSHLVNGSRLASDELAAVQHTSPAMSVIDADPGAKWEELPQGASLPASVRQVLMLATGSDPRPALVEQLAHQPLPKRATLPQPMHA